MSSANGGSGVGAGAVNGRVSFWYAQDGLQEMRARLDGDATADVVIVGGGYTGLWSAYYVNDPGLKSRACTAGATGCGAALASWPALGCRGWVWGG